MNHALFNRLVLQGFEPGDCNPEEWAVRRVERLRALLDCEAGVRAPEGWLRRHVQPQGWVKGPRCMVLKAEPAGWRWINHTGHGHARYALLAIEAAEGAP